MQLGQGPNVIKNLADDMEMGKRARGIYAVGNTLISKFKHCSISSKILLFKTYCYNIYANSLWTSFRVNSYAKVKVAHNDIFRSLLKVQRSESASALFASNNVFNLDVINRNSMYSLIERLLSSENKFVYNICNSEVKTHSKIWKRWSVALGIEWDSLMRY